MTPPEAAPDSAGASPVPAQVDVLRLVALVAARVSAAHDAGAASVHKAVAEATEIEIRQRLALLQAQENGRTQRLVLITQKAGELFTPLVAHAVAWFVANKGVRQSATGGTPAEGDAAEAPKPEAAA